MQPIPSDISTQFEAVLKKRAVPVARHADYRKWLLYYLDFRSKYTLQSTTKVTGAEAIPHPVERLVMQSSSAF